MKERFKRFLHYLYISIKRPEMEVLPGNLSFFFMMMIIPLLTILGIVISRIDFLETTVYDALMKSFPNNIANLIISISAEGSSSIGVYTLLIVSLVLASNGTYSMIVTSNSIYGIKNTSYLKNKAKSIVLVILLVLLFIVLLMLPILNTKFWSFIERLTHTDMATNAAYLLYRYIRYPVTFLLVFVFVKILYRFAPSKDKSKKKTSYGAIFASVFLVIATWLYSYYIEYFSTYETFYGSISSLLFLMIYLYLISYIFVLGMSLNAARDKMANEVDKE